MNLLEETKEAVGRSGHDVSDIKYIGSRKGHSCTWDEFTKLADFDYDHGFGGQRIATDLIIVFKDGIIMKRGEYDGSEWWEYQMPFFVPKETKPITKLKGEHCWVSLEGIHDPDY